MAEHSHGNGGNRPSGGGKAHLWVFLGFALIAAYFLFTEHRAHMIQFLPFLLVLACPLLHLFHGHGHGGDGDEQQKRKDEPHGGH
jgi:hypothetical protein